MLTPQELSFAQDKLSFLTHLKENQHQYFLNNISTVSYKKGTTLHSPDNECLGMILVKSGELRTYMLSEDGREVTLYRLSAGQICVLSASCILSNITFDVQIDAEQDSEILLLGINAFSSLCEQNIYVENFSYKNAVSRFSDVMWAMEQILFQSFDKRLAGFLVDESNKTNSLELKITQDQIAKYIGSAREVVSRMLKTFQKAGIIQQSRGSISILRKDKLMDLLSDI